MQNGTEDAIRAGKKDLVNIIPLAPDPLWRSRRSRRREAGAAWRAFVQQGSLSRDLAVKRVRCNRASRSRIGKEKISVSFPGDGDRRINLQHARRGARWVVVIPDDLGRIGTLEIQ